MHGTIASPQDALAKIDLLVLPSEAEGFGLVLIEAALDSSPADAAIAAGMGAVIEEARKGERPPAFLVVAPEGDDDVGARLERASAGAEFEPLAGAIGWLSWRELGSMALDLAEEADPMRDEQVHRLVSQLQSRFPNLEV